MSIASKVTLASLAQFLEQKESSRSMALIRIGLVLLIWSIWARDFTLLTAFNRPISLILGLFFFPSSIALLFGFHARIFKWVFAGTMLLTYYFLGHLIGEEPYTHHHRYILAWSTFLLAFSTSENSLSYDRYHSAAPELSPTWVRFLFCAQVSLIYFWSAFDKSSTLFLSGARFEQIFMYLYFGSDYPQWSFFPWFVKASAWFVVALEYALAVTLWIPRVRYWAIVAGVLLHALIYYTLPVNTFSLTMCLLYLAFIPPEVIHRIIDALVTDSRAPR